MSDSEGRPLWSYLIPSRPPPLEAKHWNVLGLVLIAEVATQYCSALLILALPQVQVGLAMSEGQVATIGGTVRIGMVFTIFITAFADRWGRRRMLLGSTALLCALTGASGFATSFEQYLVLQTLARVFIGAEFMLGAVVITEEFIATQRGFGIGALSALGALGYAVAIGLYAPLDALPEAWIRDGWRALHVAGALPILLLPALARRLEETTRFTKARISVSPIRMLFREHRTRLLGLGVFALAIEVVGWPAFTLVSKYLREVHAYDSAGVSMVILTGGVVGIAGNLVAGQLGDRFGRRPVGVGMIALSALSTWALYGTTAVWVPLVWAGFVFSLSGVNVVMTALSGELFPTSARSTAAGFRMSLASIGGALGFYLESILYRGSHGDAIVMLLPVLGLAALSLVFLPESAGRELEELAPADPAD